MILQLHSDPCNRRIIFMISIMLVEPDIWPADMLSQPNTACRACLRHKEQQQLP